MLGVEKGAIRTQKLERILNTLNTDCCCPKLMINDMISKDKHERDVKKRLRELEKY